MLAGAVLCLALEVWMIGVINPSGVSTATAMSAVS